jgi:CDP-diacylglycerol--glycerol-3-phosphate 3-phosphatidyltransferase
MSAPATGSEPRPGRVTRRRLVGLDRSGPEPPATRRGQPLRPFTIPNGIGYLRVAAIPVFLYLAFESDDGRTAASAILYAAICGSDYLDGLLARATGQYSRMGAILDPVVDRLAVLSGVAVCWHFELLPRWALAVLIARELVTLLLAQLGLRRGIDLEINWMGRIGVILVMGGIFVALVADTFLASVLLYVGLVFSILATVLYVRVALAKTRHRPSPA